MPAKRIGLSLTGDTIPLRIFIEAARNLSALLSELDVAISGARNLDWAISDLSVGSALFAVTPSLISEDATDQSALVIAATLAGVDLVEKSPEWPTYFTDEALLKAKELGSLINSHVERMSLFGNSGHGETRRVRITQRVAANVDQLIGTSTTAIGSVEGTLETLTVHGGTAFNVYDVITLRRVRCVCDREMLDKLAPHLDRRVFVEGEVKFNTRGHPISVKVANYRLFKNREYLPQAKDIRGLFVRDKVNTEELSDYLRS